MANKSKIKGSAFESEICKFLSKVFGSTFSRTGGSGARFGGKNSTRTTNLNEESIKPFLGDVFNPDINLVIECKNYAPKNIDKHFLTALMVLDTNKFSINDGKFNIDLSTKSKVLSEWIEQVKSDSKVAKSPYILFIKISGINTFICFPKKYFPEISSEKYLKYKHNKEEYIITVGLEENKDNILWVYKNQKSKNI